jgi:hypothetical protein
MAADAPVLDLKADMEAEHGPTVVKFDTEASAAPVSALDEYTSSTNV